MKNEYEIRGDLTVIFLKHKDGTSSKTVINTADLKLAKEFKNTWYASKNKSTDTFYVLGKVKQKTFCLHRWLFNNPEGLLIDHINHDTLDNRRDNLRTVTNSQNMQNLKAARIDSKSGVRGVFWEKARNKWIARVRTGNKNICVGLFSNLNEAEKAVIKARKIYMPYSLEEKV